MMNSDNHTKKSPVVVKVSIVIGDYLHESSATVDLSTMEETVKLIGRALVDAEIDALDIYRSRMK